MTENKTFVIADIHGGLLALKQCIERANVSPGDTIIFLGDYVDGWSESAQVIEYILELKKDHNCITILGNHDAWCRDWLISGASPQIWLKQGGQATVDSYINSKLLADKRHLQFFQECKLFYIDKENRGFVHGGFSDPRGLGWERYKADYYWDRSLIQDAIQVHNLTNNFDNFHKEVYVGHTTVSFWLQDDNGKIKTTDNWRRDDIKPLILKNVIGLDTGAGHEGKLTIMNVETKEYWQSDKVSTLYPNEKGRG